MDEIFGENNFIAQITFKKSSSATEKYLSSTSDFLVWFGKRADLLKYRPIRNMRVAGGDGGEVVSFA
jgi:adenine-specific DNA-methyltransferase